METRDQLTIRARDGFPLTVQVSGAPEAPALLLLPGQSNSHHWWDELRSDFEPQFRTVTFDYRGTGGSRGRLDEPSTASFAEDAAEVLDQLDIASACVYGTSMGGRVAQMLALNFPERVDALVLACTTPGGPNSVKRPREVGQSLAIGPTARPRAYALPPLPLLHSGLVCGTALQQTSGRRHYER